VTALPRRTVRSVSAPYENFLCPLPPAVDGVCMVCRSRANPGWARCWKCDNEALTVGPRTADAVAFVALAPEEGGQRQLAHELYAYKDRGGSPRLIAGLGSVLWRWLGAHEDCLASACHVSAFDMITAVPSSSSGRTGDHPLVNVVSGVVAGSQERYKRLLVPSGLDVERREFSDRRFKALGDLTGLRVLLIDDTWTTGSHMLGAARALKKAGAQTVGGVALGRWYHPSQSQNATVEEARKGLAWTWDTCMLCADE